VRKTSGAKLSRFEPAGLSRLRHHAENLLYTPAEV